MRLLKCYSNRQDPSRARLLVGPEIVISIQTLDISVVLAYREILKLKVIQGMYTYPHRMR